MQVIWVRVSSNLGTVASLIYAGKMFRIAKKMNVSEARISKEISTYRFCGCVSVQAC